MQKPNFAAHGKIDSKKNLPPSSKDHLGNSSQTPAETPTPNASARKPADARINQPAIKMVKEITGRYPPKDQWDRIIREIRVIDTEFFKASWEIWRGFDGNPNKLDGWLFEPNERKIVPQRFEKNNRSNSEPPSWIDVGTPKPAKDVENPKLSQAARLSSELLELREMQELGGLEDFEKYYSEEDWQWLMKNLENTDVN